MKTLLAIICLFVVPAFAEANLDLAPPDFNLRDGSGRAVFVHFDSANYEVNFDIGAERTRVRSFIRFSHRFAGQPVFDLVDEPISVAVDGEPVAQELIEAPDSRRGERVRFRVVKKNLAAGSHALSIEHELKAFPARYGPGKVRSGFFMWDFDPRGLLERYLPANLEYDQVPMRMVVRLQGAVDEHFVVANGRVTRTAKDQWEIEFPRYFNCSSLYFHIRPVSETKSLAYDYHSVEGRKIPVFIYEDIKSGRDLKPFKSLLDSRLGDYERRFGPFRHPSLNIYNTGTARGAMEYSGAAFTDLDSLPHELAHSYFGRGVMPANGNAGWIDEAMATYAGGPYLSPTGRLEAKNMSAHSPYFRANDSTGYTYGVNLLMHLDESLGQKKTAARGIDRFLAEWFTARFRQVITPRHLQADLERFTGKDLSSLFRHYVYAGSQTEFVESAPGPHQPMQKSELFQAQ